MKRDEYLIGIHHLPAILEAATKHGCNHVTNKPEPAHSPGKILSGSSFSRSQTNNVTPDISRYVSHCCCCCFLQIVHAREFKNGSFNSCVGLSVEKFACVSWMVSRLRQEVVTPGSW